MVKKSIDNIIALVFNETKQGEDKMKKILNKKGFTLIELIVVIAILAILALILVPTITNYIGEATASRDQANSRSLYSEVALKVATGTITGNGSVTGPDGLTCTYTIASNQVATFSCTGNGRTYSLANNFAKN